MRLLIAYDGSSFSKIALDDLRRAGLPPDTEAMVLSVADVWGPSAPPDAYEGTSSELDRVIRVRAQENRQHVAEAVEQARALATEAAQSVQAAFPEWNVRAEACSGAPAWELLKQAEAWPSDLVVVGTQGRTALGRLLLGSVSQKVLSEAHCSVRVARQSAGEAGSPPRILVAVDGSAHAETVVRAVAARSWPSGSEIRLLVVDDPFNRPAAGSPHGSSDDPSADTTEEPEAWLNQVIETASQILGSTGPKVSHAVRWGDARHAIVEESKEWQADSIFVGARGLGRLKRLLLGSISSAVATHAPCSVEVVRSRG
jgi:nucleotide-binding universal stress UspA family protein